jgi:hypothetical protein
MPGRRRGRDISDDGDRDRARREGGRLACIAPFGLDDLFALTARPNRRLVSEAVYRAKAARWQGRWPELTVLPW